VLGVERPAFHIVAYREASRLLGLDDLVVASLAGRLVIVGINEKIPVTGVRDAMVNRRRRHQLVTLQVTFAERLAIELLLPETARPAPNGQVIQCAVRLVALALRVVSSVACSTVC